MGKCQLRDGLLFGLQWCAQVSSVQRERHSFGRQLIECTYIIFTLWIRYQYDGEEKRVICNYWCEIRFLKERDLGDGEEWTNHSMCELKPSFIIFLSLQNHSFSTHKTNKQNIQVIRCTHLLRSINSHGFMDTASIATYEIGW